MHVKFIWMEILSSWGQRAVSPLLEFIVWCGCDCRMKFSMTSSMKGHVVWGGDHDKLPMSKGTLPLICSFPSLPGNGANKHLAIQITSLGPSLLPPSPSHFVSSSSASPVRSALKYNGHLHLLPSTFLATALQAPGRLRLLAVDNKCPCSPYPVRSTYNGQPE